VELLEELEGGVELHEEGEGDAFWRSLAVDELVDRLGVEVILALLVVDLD
jgi:hypothetical protein